MQGNAMVLQPFYTRLSSSYLGYFQLLLSLDDDVLLRQQSTSPDHEGPNFVAGETPCCDQCTNVHSTATCAVLALPRQLR